MVFPSDKAFFGFGWVSKKIPSTFAAIPAHPKVSMNKGVPQKHLHFDLVSALNE